MVKRALWLFVFMALIAAACSGSDSSDDAADALEQRLPQGSILPPAEQDPDQAGSQPGQAAPQPNNDDGRLVVQSDSQQLTTMLPDGTEVVELTDAGTANTQATWAPDGSRLAWVSVDPSTGDAAIATDRFDRSDFRAVPVTDAPFYLYWDPSASRIAHLSPDPAGIDLGIAEPFAEEGPTSRRIDRGQPYFMSWGPDGDELLVHASGFRFDRIDLGSATIIVDDFPARFGAPTWLEDGTLIFADTEDEEQFLITTGSAGQGRRPLVTFEGSLRFSVSNLGNRIAMQATPSAADEDGIVTASAPTSSIGTVGQVSLAAQPSPTPTPGFDDSLDAIDEIQPGIPYVMGTFGGEPFPLSNRPALALYPSPDGQSVAWVEAAVGVPNALVWRLDSGGTTFATPPFLPSAEMLQAYLPFFDQYNLSHDYWSPSSNLFVFAGRPANSAEADGIWVMDRRTGAVDRIADGVVASFTRTPAAAGAASAL